MINIIKLPFSYIFCYLFLLINHISDNDSKQLSIIKAGTSKLIGRIISSNKDRLKSCSVNVMLSQPISGEYVTHKATVDQFGNFKIDAEVEIDTCLVVLTTSFDPEKSLLVKLVSGGVTTIDIKCNSQFEIETVTTTPIMSQGDIFGGLVAMNKMIGYRPERKPEPLYDKSSDHFLNHAKTVLSERLRILNTEESISQDLKLFLAKEFSMFLYNSHVFDYRGEMMLNYKNTTAENSNAPDIKQIDQSYFGFLKDLNLDDQQNLRCFSFQEIQKQILRNEILALPKISDTDIPSWLKSVKIVLSKLVGFNNDQYYDVLIANAYAMQLNDEILPLTDKQKNNIFSYWKNSEIARILLRKNQKVEKLSLSKSPAILNNVSSIPDNKILEAIVSKQKGKVIFIDLWATWCGPCLAAMQEFQGTKNEHKNKNVAFVYITNGSSPMNLWKDKIIGIGDEHYYLNQGQWKYLMNSLSLEAIPSYLIYNKEGVLVKKFTGFPGNEYIKGVFKDLL